MTNAMNSNSDPALAPQFGAITFLGGTADLEEEEIAPQVASSPTPKGVQLPLAMTSVGDRVWIVNIKGGHRLVRRLMDVGIVQGCDITVVSRMKSGSVIVALQGCRIGLGAGMAHRVFVTSTELDVTSPAPEPEHATFVRRDSHLTPTTLTYGALSVGRSGRFVGYEPGGRAYRGKLLSMGLTPGTSFTVTRQAPMGDPVDVEVRGYHLSLRKDEAAALKVEPLTPAAAPHES